MPLSSFRRDVVSLLLIVLFLSNADGQTPDTPAPSGPVKFHPLNLQPKANQKRADDFHQDNLPGNNLLDLASGQHRLLGIPYQVGDGVLQLGSSGVVKNKPAKIDGIKVGAKFARLRILHATAYSYEEEEVVIGSYTVRYGDGATRIIPIVNRKDVDGWWKRRGAPEPKNAKIAWEGTNDRVAGIGGSIRLFASTWENPRPDAAAASIDFASNMTKCAPFCVAITAEIPLTARAAAGPLSVDDLETLWKQLADDGDKAFDAIETLAGSPKQTIPFLARRMNAAEAAALDKRIGDLVSRLDDENFRVREKATQELEKHGLEAPPILRRALDDKTSPEARRRIDRVLEKLKSAKHTSDQKRSLGALLVFELSATAGAIETLEEAAKGRAGAWLAGEAQGSLLRMRKMKA